MVRRSTPSDRPLRAVIMAIGLWAMMPSEGVTAELFIGGATTSITPDRPVALAGQMQTRVSKDVESPVTATALALESRQGEKVLDQAIFVSCDLVAIEAEVIDQARKRLRDQIADFDATKLTINATHTHTAPVVREGAYEIPREGVMQPEQYREFLLDRLTEAIVKAWKARKPGSVSWGLGHAVLAHNRRAVYADGHAQMYGRTDNPEFRHIEGNEDHGVEVLFLWDRDQRLMATAINVACPSQEVEGRSSVNADFWHEVREDLRGRHGRDLLVLAWTGAAGDQSPHLMYRKAAEERMRALRGLTRLQELEARRVVQAWEEAYDGARKEIHPDVSLVHKVERITLPVRRVTREEYDAAKKRVEVLSADPKEQTLMRWHRTVVERFERQEAGQVAPYEMELHVVRLGDVAIATNDFELFTDFGTQIKARSRGFSKRFSFNCPVRPATFPLSEPHAAGATARSSKATRSATMAGRLSSSRP